MLLEARLTQEDLRVAVLQFAPVRIRLGEDGELTLQDASVIRLVPGKGLRIVCNGQLRWSVLGIALPVTLQSISVVITPSVDARPGGEALVLKLEIERAEIALIPQVIGDHVTDRVNKELEAKHVELSWAFLETQSHVFEMLASLVNLDSFGIRAVGGSIEVTRDALVFGVAFTTDVVRKPAAAA